jgi:uncharacterized protein (DUF488 family)
MTMFCTVGHSDRTLEDFLELLASTGVERVVDVRKLPGSRAHPQFDHDVLSAALAGAGVAYRHEAALGGLRPVSKTVPPDVNGFWRNRSFHNYADHALSVEFADAITRLREEGRDRSTALMCSEAVWWRCHRRIIADHLLAAGEQVEHIMGHGRLDVAVLNAGAVVGADGTVVYPAAAT